MKTFERRRSVLRTLGLLAAATATALTVSVPVHAQGAYPNKTIRFIVPYAAGGLPDTVARLVAQRLQDRLGQTVVVDNRPGGNGGVAAGVPVIFVRWGFSRPGEEDGAIATVDDVEQLRALLLPPRDAPPAASADELATEADRANG